MLMISPSSTSAMVTADSSLRGNMTNRRTSGCTGETTVRNQRNTGTKTHTCDCRSRIQHFSHAGAAFGALVTNHNDIAGNNLAALDRSNRVLFAVKYPCRSFMNHHFRYNSASLYNTGIRSQVAFEYSDTARLRYRDFQSDESLRDCGLHRLRYFRQRSFRLPSSGLSLTVPSYLIHS